jgi:hypothetical protein
LLITYEWCSVEDIESATIVQTGVTPAEIHFGVGRKMTDPLADELSEAYQYERSQSADEKCTGQAER